MLRQRKHEIRSWKRMKERLIDYFPRYQFQDHVTREEINLGVDNTITFKENIEGVEKNQVSLSKVEQFCAKEKICIKLS